MRLRHGCVAYKSGILTFYAIINYSTLLYEHDHNNYFTTVHSPQVFVFVHWLGQYACKCVWV